MLRNVSRCEASTQSAFHSSVPYHTPKKKTTDAITSDSPPRHFGTPKDINASAPIRPDASFDDLINMYLAKYTDGSEYRALLSMTYFGDADSQPMPYMFEDVDWKTVKNKIREEVEYYSKNHS